MPVLLDPRSDDIRTWLDPARHEWDGELQSLLRPYDGELDVYPVSKDVGKVGNNSPSFIVPLDSKENRSNIANLFANARQKAARGDGNPGPAAAVAVGGEEREVKSPPPGEASSARKRKASSPATRASPAKRAAAAGARTRSATRNERKGAAARAKPPPPPPPSRKITSFFGSSA